MDASQPTTVIIVFSRSGHARRIAEKLAHALNARVIILNAPAYNGLQGYLHAGSDSLKQTRAVSPQSFTTLADYDRVVLCGPVWTFDPALPLRDFPRSDIPLPRSVSLFLTSGSPPLADKAFDLAKADLGRPLTAMASLSNGEEPSTTEDRIIETVVKDRESAESNQADPAFVRRHAR